MLAGREDDRECVTRASCPRELETTATRAAGPYPAQRYEREERVDKLSVDAVQIGVLVAVGIGIVMAFMTGLGTVFTTLLQRIQGVV